MKVLNICGSNNKKITNLLSNKNYFQKIEKRLLIL